MHEKLPDNLLAYNCSPSFNWRSHLENDEIAGFQRELGAMGYRFQFVTVAGFHSLNAAMFELARGCGRDGMSAYVELQQREFELEDDGYTASAAPAAGAGYFDAIAGAISGGESSTLALDGSTEAAQISEAVAGDDAVGGTKADEIALALEDAIVSGSSRRGRSCARSSCRRASR